MNVTHKQLRAFVAVAKTRSFAEACSLVHLSQPALSIAIKNLEEAAGGRLLARTTRTLALTPEGETFYPIAQRLLADWDDAMEDLHNHFALQRGKITIAAMPSFACNLLPYAIRRFRQQYPGVNVAVNDVIAEEVVELVRKGRIELGITFDPGTSEDLVFAPLFEDHFVAVLPTDHPLLEQQTLSWKALASDDFVLLQRPSSIRVAIERKMQELGYGVATVLEAHQLATVGRMVATGLGISVVPALCIEQMQELGAECRPLDAPGISRRVGVLSRRRYPLSIAASSMKEILLQTLSCEEGQLPQVTNLASLKME